MPVYMGNLSLGDEKIQEATSTPQPQQQQHNDETITSTSSAIVAPIEPPQNAEPKALERSHRRGTSTGHIISEPRIARSATKEWTPSGGAKLTSNLSIVLSNATAGFTKPNVIDLKLGARLWDDDAPLSKRAKLDEVARESTSGTLGFRVAGMKVYVGEGEGVQREVNTEVHDGYKTYDKFYGRKNVDDSTIDEAFEAFLYSLALKPSGATSEGEQRKALLRRKLLVERLLREISSIQYVLENEESRMYSASVLMVYEGDPDALDGVIRYKEGDGKIIDVEALEADEPDELDGEDDDKEMDDQEEDEELKQKIHEVVMIDFAHAHWTPGQGPDENVLQGIRSIKRILEQLLATVQKQIES